MKNWIQVNVVLTAGKTRACSMNINNITHVEDVGDPSRATQSRIYINVGKSESQVSESVIETYADVLRKISEAQS